MVIERLLDVGREIAWITPVGLGGQREHALAILGQLVRVLRELRRIRKA